MHMNAGNMDVEIKRLIARCERYVVSDDIPRFYACIDALGLSDWKKREAVLITDDGDMLRLLAYKVIGSDVVSILAVYRVEDEGLSYSGLEVDISNVEDVKRVLGDL